MHINPLGVKSHRSSLMKLELKIIKETNKDNENGPPNPINISFWPNTCSNYGSTVRSGLL